MISKFSDYKIKVNIFVALVVLINAFAPLSVVAKEMFLSDDTSVEALFGEKILICTPYGFKYISIDTLNDHKKGDQQEPSSHCPLCQISVLSSILYQVDFSRYFEFEDREKDKSIFVATPFLKSMSLFKAANPRAPPVFL